MFFSRFSGPYSESEPTCKFNQILMPSKILVLTVITATLFLTSCSPAGKLKRAQKLIDKAEQAGAKWSVDTVYITKEVIVPERVLDTLVRYVNLTDTITVTENNVVTK